MIQALIIDDEVDGRETLRTALESYCPQVRLLTVCDHPVQGLEAIRSLKPDLVFLDIQMPQLSGFDLLQQVAPVDFEVIFVTAHDRYAIRAIRFSALDYLLKPIDVDDLLEAVRRVEERRLGPGSAHRYQSVLNNMQYRSRRIEKLAVPTLEGIEFFETDDIIFCRAEGNYTLLYLKNNRKKLVSRNLKDFESLLCEPDFCRVHHSALISMRHIQKYVRGDGGYVLLTDGYHVDISRRKKDEFLQLLHRI
ncbi:LytR/AlgR family response regulator transcription factor [Larkinella soli]|uniref:LytR/AlgR family response regulator transcription factor n=1 Tax=Larkinella soli TaxID=1770527 RepID=UPI000FFB5677|nr:LytTR family DNA-binding domain-containing protein [Larkinella soli]